MKFRIIILFFVLLHCKEQRTSSGEVCFSKVEKEILIKTILNHEKVRNYLHLEIEDRNPIKLKANGIINKDLNIAINGHKVLITNNTAVKDLVLLKFSEINCDQKKVNFSIFFNIENANIMGMVQKNRNWEIVIKKEVEF